MDKTDAIKVYVFNEQSWPQDTLAQLWKICQDEGTPSVMWRDGVPMTLNTWIRWFTESTRLVFLPVRLQGEHVPTIEDVMGVCWLDDIIPPRASAHFWIRRKFLWKHQARRACGKILDGLFQETNFRVLLCHLNAENRGAIKFAKQCGMVEVGSVPDWFQHGETYYPVTIGYITPASWQEKRRQYGEL